MGNQDRWITDKEVAEMIGASRQTIIKWRVEGKGIPYYQIGRSIRYKLQDVLDYMEARRVEVKK